MIRPSNNASNDGFCSEETTKSPDRQPAANARLHLATGGMSRCYTSAWQANQDQRRAADGPNPRRRRRGAPRAIREDRSGEEGSGFLEHSKGEIDDSDADLLATRAGMFRKKPGCKSEASSRAHASPTEERQDRTRLVSFWGTAIQRWCEAMCSRWSGRRILDASRSFPKSIVRAFFGLEQAKRKIHSGLVPLLDELESHIGKRAD
jgi:hypothetical protein